MILDSSVVIAILKDEPEAESFSALLEATQLVRISAANYFESSLVIDGWKNPKLSVELDEMMERSRVIVEPVTFDQARIARQAYRDYGKGSGHPAGLNFGDCFSYALARVKREPLLFKGDDFIHTDIRPAVPKA
jgi:ribonuclease VapC